MESLRSTLAQSGGHSVAEVHEPFILDGSNFLSAENDLGPAVPDAAQVDGNKDSLENVMHRLDGAEQEVGQLDDLDQSRSRDLPAERHSLLLDNERTHIARPASLSLLQAEHETQVKHPTSLRRRASSRHHKAAAHSSVEHSPQPLLEIGRRILHQQPGNATAEESGHGNDAGALVMILIAFISVNAICFRCLFGMNNFLSEVDDVDIPDAENCPFCGAAYVGTLDICGTCGQKRVRQESPRLTLLKEAAKSLQIYVYMLIFVACIFYLAWTRGYVDDDMKPTMLMELVVLFPFLWVCCWFDFTSGTAHKRVEKLYQQLDQHKDKFVDPKPRQGC